MPIVIIARNGIGLGHVSRSIGLCNRLHRAAHKPYLLVQSRDVFSIPHAEFPCQAVNSPQFKMSRARFGAYVNTLATLSSPSIVIEDTIPQPLRLSEVVRRFLLLRPTEFGPLVEFEKTFGHEYDRILVADHPESPTWPYDVEQTRFLNTLPNWTFVGPVYRSSEPEAVNELRDRYRASSKNRLCVFSMGGGGQHQGSNDARDFIDKSCLIAEMLLNVDPFATLIFVKGPLFPKHVSIPRVFTTVDEEPLMPALFAIADLAIIRPGFNSTWECLNAGTPFVPIIGTSFQEPIQARLENLFKAGIAVADPTALWGNDDRLRYVWQQTRKFAYRWPGYMSTEDMHALFGDGAMQGLPATEAAQPVQTQRTVPRVFIYSVGKSDAILNDLRSVLRSLSTGGFEVFACIFDPRSRTIFRMTSTEIYSPIVVSGTEECEALLTSIPTDFDPHIIVSTGISGRVLSILTTSSWMFRAQVQGSATGSDAVIDFPSKPLLPIIDRHEQGAGEISSRTSSESQSETLTFSFTAPSFEKAVEYIASKPNFDPSDEMMVNKFRGLTGAPIAVRIDDICQMTPRLRRLVSSLTQANIPVSLEVVPYLCDFSDRELDTIDPHGSLIEISQHGYSHLARVADENRKSEFSSFSPAPLEEELQQIAEGKRIIESRFPVRFRGGFSAPYDVVPEWLGPVWLHCGGTYFSCLHERPRGARLRHLQMTVDVWKWDKNQRRSIAGVWGDIYSSVVRLGYVGLVLHQQHFHSRADLDWINNLFSVASRCGLTPAMPSTLAHLDAERLITSSNRTYNLVQDASYE